MAKPGIIVMSKDDEDSFRWLSDGWYEMKKAHTKEAQSLMKKAHEAIEAAEDVPDAIERLKQAGFAVRRDPKVEKQLLALDPNLRDSLGRISQ